jgi:hypothetical protein
METNNVRLTHAELNLLRQAVDCLITHQYDLAAESAEREQPNLNRSINDLLALKDRLLTYSFSNLP